MIRSRLLLLIVGFCFILVSVVPDSFACQGCNVLLCQDAEEETCHSNGASDLVSKNGHCHARSSCCSDSAAESETRGTGSSSGCASFCSHSQMGIRDCHCSLPTQSGNYLPATPSSVFDLSSLQNCFVICAVLPLDGSSCYNYLFMKDIKAKELIPIYLQNASFLL